MNICYDFWNWDKFVENIHETNRWNYQMNSLQAFQRESVLLVTKWKENESKVFYLDQEEEPVKSARYASYLAMGLAGIYIAKKALKWWNNTLVMNS